MDRFEISGQRVRLRDFLADDLDAYARWHQPGHAWQRLDAPYYPHPSDEQRAAEIAKLATNIATGDWPAPRTRTVISDIVTEQMLGTVSWYWISRETNWPAVGIVLFDPATWGHGIGAEAMTLWCDHLWQALPQISRIDLRTWSGNVAMCRLAEKLGFALEARFRNARLLDGKYFDGIGYGVLRDQWRARGARETRIDDARMSFHLSEPYAPRPIRLLGIHQHADYRIKLYSITYGDEPLDRAAYEEAMQLALRDLPQPAITCHRPGVAFAILHQGRGWHYLVLSWWDNENELPQRIWVREREDSSATWRHAAPNQSICVWDLQIIWFEREAYVRHVLSGAGGIDEYLCSTLA